MAESLDLPLPELNGENFKRALIRFELVAKAKNWTTEKQLTILPMLLRGKLVDHFTEFDETTRGDLDKLKSALEKAAGVADDPLTAARTFMSRDQGPLESVKDFAAALRKLFKQAYPEEALTSSVLLQRFLTGLRPLISRQLLLRKKLTELDEAIDGAVEVEYALGFDGGRIRENKDVNLVQPLPTQPSSSEDKLSQLQSALDAMMKRMEALETTIVSTQQGNQSEGVRRRGGPADQPRRRPTICFLCRQEGHIRRNCPLNYVGPARRADDWPRRY